MIVVFQSESENKSIKRVERILDTFANRIGRRSWITAITEEGLDSVHHELRRVATKDTSVSCLLIKGRAQTELLWIVGRRDRFNSNGNTPVNETSNTKYMVSNENRWKYLPLITGLVAISSLWHDVGKSSEWFQNKLRNKNKKGDPLRHDWMSCMFLYAYIKSIDAKNDKEWLSRLSNGDIDGKQIISTLKGLKEDSDDFFLDTKNYPVFHFISWLILSHHRFPGSMAEIYVIEKYKRLPIVTFDFLLRAIKPDLGYATGDEKERNKVFSFPKGISVFDDSKWKREISKWTGKLLIWVDSIYEFEKTNMYYEILMLARSALVLADHKQSSLKGTAKGFDVEVANLNQNGTPNQTLIEHLLGVESIAIELAYYLPRLQEDLPSAHDIKILKRKSPEKYGWQNKAVEEIKRIKKDKTNEGKGFFIVNMASTGCGKTLANAKILYALSSDESLRCSILLGLRTLTLQTGNEYKEKLGLSKDDLGIVVGSKAFVELSSYENKEVLDEDSENDKAIFEEIESGQVPDDFPLKKWFSDGQALKALYSSVLVSTIDQIIKASESTSGAHNIIPILRILTSDIVIDEVDDYSGDDLIAVGRLIYLCGVFGRNVIISSATIPPEVSEGLASAYQKGWSEHVLLHGGNNQVINLLVDEFCSVSFCEDSFIEYEKESNFRNKYKENLKGFIDKRVRKLEQIGSRRKGEIVSVDIKNEDCYFESIDREILLMHKRHFEIDPLTQKRISFGLVRFSNIKQCIAYSRHITMNFPSDIIDLRYVTYHAREVMLIRHMQECYLDRILCRKEPLSIFEDAAIRKHIDTSGKQDITFVVVSSPVEELGRDHDFDWAIIEPASYRSIIQTSGRVLRHRDLKPIEANIGILQYNWNSIFIDEDKPCYCNPGFETQKNLLTTHDLHDLINEEEINQGITSIPRISFIEKVEVLDTFVSLEHLHVSEIFDKKDIRIMNEFASFYSTPAMLTAFSQRIHPFRKQDGRNKELFLLDNGDRLYFAENAENGWNDVTRQCGIKIQKNENSLYDWLDLSYDKAVEELAEKRSMSMEEVEKKYGSLCFPYEFNNCWKYSDRYGLEEVKYDK